jgi:hypothetical protein
LDSGSECNCRTGNFEVLEELGIEEQFQSLSVSGTFEADVNNAQKKRVKILETGAIGVIVSSSNNGWHTVSLEGGGECKVRTGKYEVVEMKEMKPKVKARFLALLVSHPESRFQEDVARLKSAMEDAGYEVEALFGPKPGQILDKINELAQQCGEEDVCVFYTSGHGVRDSNGTLELEYDGSLPAANLVEALKEVSSRHMLVMIHCCYAGAFPAQELANNSSETEPQPNIEAGVKKDMSRNLAESSGKVVIFAGPPDKITYGNVFPAGVCKAFKDATKEGRRLKWSKLYAEVSEHVDESLNEEGCRQHQYLQLTTPGGNAGDFDLWNAS